MAYIIFCSTPGRGVDTHPHPPPRLKEELSYTSTPPLGFRCLL